MNETDPNGANAWPPRPPVLDLNSLPEPAPHLPGTPVGGLPAEDVAPPPAYQAPPPAPGIAHLRLDQDLVKWPNGGATSPASPAEDEMWSPDVFGEDSGKFEKIGTVVGKQPGAAIPVAPPEPPAVAPAAPPAAVPMPSLPSVAPTLPAAPVIPLLAPPDEPVAAAPPPAPAAKAPAPAGSPLLPHTAGAPPVATSAVNAAAPVSAKKQRGRKKNAAAPMPAPAPAAPPSISEANRESIEMLRKQAVKTRKRNQRVARTVFAIMGLFMAAAGAGLVYLFLQEEKKENDTDVASATTVAGDESGDAPGVLGAAVGAIGGAEDLVGDLNGTDAAPSGETPGAVALADVTVDQLLPALFVPLGDEVGPADAGWTRMVFDGPTLAAVDGQAFADWLVLVTALPQSDDVSASLAAGGLPELESGQIGVALAVEGGTVTRFVAVSADGSLTADA